MAPFAISETLMAKGELKKRKVLLKPVDRIIDPFAGKKTISYRNALIASKAEEVIAPQLQRELGRKPAILIRYGAFHTGIAELLRNKAKRRHILSRLPKSWQHFPETTDMMEFQYNPEKEQWEGKYGKERIILPARKTRMQRIRARWRLAKQKVRKAVPKRRQPPS